MNDTCHPAQPVADTGAEPPADAPDATGETAAPAPDANLLFAASYTVDLPVLERYARLNVCRQVRAFAAFLAIVSLVVGLMLVTAQTSLWPIATALGVFGILMIVWHQAIPRMTAKRLLRNLPADRLHREVAVYEDRTVLTAGSAAPRTYPMEAFRGLRWSDRAGMAVLVFGTAGVTIPHEALTAGTWGDLLVWGETHRADQP